MEPIETYAADGLSVEIFKNNSGMFGVRLFDTDAGIQFPQINFFSVLASAQAFAKKCL